MVAGEAGLLCGVLLFLAVPHHWVSRRQVTDVKSELQKRGITVSRWANPWKLMKQLDRALEAEEDKEKFAMKEASEWNEWRDKLKAKQQDAMECHIKAEEELALALDAAGQVYFFGTGESNEFAGTAIPPRGVDPDLLLRLWTQRIAPELTRDEDGKLLPLPR